VQSFNLGRALSFLSVLPTRNHSRVVAGSILLALMGFQLPLLAQSGVSKANYKQANKYSSSFISQFVHSTSVQPNWIGKSDRFWYQFKTSSGQHYWLVDCEAVTKKPLFDHDEFAAKLSLALRTPIDAPTLELRGGKIDEDGKVFKFSYKGKAFEYDLATEELVAKGKSSAPPPSSSRRSRFSGSRRRSSESSSRSSSPWSHRSFSPDKMTYVFAQGHDLYFVEAPIKVRAEIAKMTAEIEKEKKAKEEAEKAAKSGKKTDDKKIDDKKTDDKKTDDKKIDDKKGDDKKGDGKKGDGKKGDGKKDDGKKDDGKKDDGKKDDGKKDDGKKDDGKKDDGKKDDGKKDDDKKDDDKKDDDKKDDDKKKKAPKDDRDKREKWADKMDEAKAIRLSKDGEDNYSFGSRSSRRNLEDDKKEDLKKKTRPSVRWSKDSKGFSMSRRDSRDVKELFLVNSLSTPRPKLERYKYAMPGEEKINRSDLYYFHRDSKKLSKVTPKWKQEAYQDVHWKLETSELRFVRQDRPRRKLELVSLDLATGKQTVLLEDAFEVGLIASQSVRYLEKRNQMIWWSERSGWGHYYLYDLSGKLKNTITWGTFRANRIVSVDEEKGMLYFTASGREKRGGTNTKENIYYQHLYRVFLDGTGLQLMDPGDATHKSSLSPSKRFVVDNFNRVDLAPKSVLRNAQGQKLMDLEETDLSALRKTGWKMPETFVVKAGDGVTDLFGNMWKPFDFNPKKKYPIILHVYPGPQQEGVTHTFSTTGSGRQQLAQLGFVVIQVGHRGGTPGRSKAYQNFSYWNMRDYALEDKKLAVEKLAAIYPFIDVERVGVYGHSGGGFFTATALLKPPYNEFFKVGVSSAGNHDNNIYNNSWSERYHGLKEVEVTVKKTDGKKTDGKKTDGKKTDGKKTEVKKTEVKKTDVKKTDVKKTDVKKTEVKKTDDKKTDDKKTDDKKTDGKKTEVKKTDDKKTDGKKMDVKKAGSRRKGIKRTNGKTVVDKDVKKTVGDSDKKTEKKVEKKTKFEIHIPTTWELAANLKGKLLIVHGDMDNNVHPAGTIRLVDALIKANKRFDMLIIPGARHGFGSARSYFTQRMWEYFSEHLLGDYQESADILEKAKSSGR
jgi:dipeptidyl-peptidase-4